MNLYPALTFHMGDWDYYVVKMSARELSESVKFAHEVYEDRTLDEAIQRTLNEGRVKKEIVEYLSRQEARFFSSIVIAAIEGDPRFYRVEVADDERFRIFQDDERLNRTFGVLKFDGTQQYYALDGQHRLAAIRTLLDREDPLSNKKPEGFEDDEFSVIIVVPDVEESRETFLQRYRRLFSNLNRYAKPTSKATNIVMDEDDAFAIATRRLVMEHRFFRWKGRDRDSKRVKTTGGKALSQGQPYFTSIVTLYDMNIELLNSRLREQEGWGEKKEGLSTFKRFRPPEEYLDELHEELELYWNCLLDELDELHNDPVNMRIHNVEDGGSDENNDDQSDHLLFWPIGQELLAEVARDLLDWKQDAKEVEDPTRGSVEHAFRGLGTVEWRLHRSPWRYLLLTHEPGEDKWRMRSEDRKEAVAIGKRILRWILGIDDLRGEEIEKLKIDWETRLIPAQDPDEVDDLWQEVEAVREDVGQV